MSLDIFKHLFFGHPVGVSVGVEFIYEIIRSETHFTFFAVEKRIAEARDMAACLPHSRMHEDICIDLVAVDPLLDESLAPGILDIVFHP